MRTSWKVGLATGAAEPQPLAIPRTNVVWPAQSSPLRRTRSPRRRRRPSTSPAASVSSHDEVSSEVVVATNLHVEITTVRADHANLWVCCHHADRAHARVDHLVFGSDAHQLGLFPTRQRILDRRARSDRHVGGTNHASHPRHSGIFLHLANQSVRDVAAAQLSLIEEGALLELRLQENQVALPA